MLLTSNIQDQVTASEFIICEDNCFYFYQSSSWRHHVVPAYWLRTTSRSAIATSRTGTAVVSMNLYGFRPMIKIFHNYFSEQKTLLE